MKLKEIMVDLKSALKDLGGQENDLNFVRFWLVSRDPSHDQLLIWCGNFVVSSSSCRRTYKNKKWFCRVTSSISKVNNDRRSKLFLSRAPSLEDRDIYSVSFDICLQARHLRIYGDLKDDERRKVARDETLL